MQIAIVSDSHVPERADGIPPEFRERIRSADHVIHAGDFTSDEALSDVRELAEELTAVYGNMDPRNVDLPAVATLSVEDATFVVTHGTGPPVDYEERVAGVVREEAGSADEAGGTVIGVSGHTHEVLDTRVNGVRLLNPGSVTGAEPADAATMMTVDVEGGAVDVTVHELAG